VRVEVVEGGMNIGNFLGDREWAKIIKK